MEFVKNPKKYIEIKNKSLFKGDVLWAYDNALKMKSDKLHPVYTFAKNLGHELAKFLFLSYMEYGHCYDGLKVRDNDNLSNDIISDKTKINVAFIRNKNNIRTVLNYLKTHNNGFDMVAFVGLIPHKPETFDAIDKKKNAPFNPTDDFSKTFEKIRDAHINAMDYLILGGITKEMLEKEVPKLVPPEEFLQYIFSLQRQPQEKK